MSPEEKTIISVSTGTMVRFLMLIVLFWLVYELRDAIKVVLTAIVIASSIEPAAHWFSRYRVPRIAGIIFVYISAFAFLGLVFYLIVPPLLSDVAGIFSSLPAYLDRTFNPGEILSFLPFLPDRFTDLFQDNIPEVGATLNKAASGFFRAASAIFGGAL
ncbi:MAG: AI-2E family transporter, partial [Patescibacteria group bacterium]